MVPCHVWRSPTRVFARVFLAFVLVTTLAVGGSAFASQREYGVDDAPIPIEFPRDDGPHSALIEWWYYTGHLFTEDGDRYGFEYVIFKGELEGLVAYVSHVAITDNPRQTFQYDQRLVAGDGVSRETIGFDLTIGDWRMAGADGEDELYATLPSYTIDLTLSSEKPPVLHDGDGYIDYGNGEASYYYSRTRIAVEGELSVDGEIFAVTGEAWFDHQWGNFTTFQGGWDWFSMQLDDNWELMLYIIWTPEAGPVIVDGSWIDPEGNVTILTPDDFTVTATGEWTSPHSGATYPSGWDVTLPLADLELTVTPSMLDQELDTTATTGIIYWEGEVEIEGTRAGEPITGLGYVELTGYAEIEQTPFDALEGTPVPSAMV